MRRTVFATALGMAVGIACATAADMASAATEEVTPEYGRCVKVASGTGTYENANCSKSGGTRNYRWEGFSAVKKTHFTTVSKSETTATLETVAGDTILCTGENGSGNYTRPQA